MFYQYYYISMHNNIIPKMKKQKIKPLQTSIPREYFESQLSTLQRNSIQIRKSKQDSSNQLMILNAFGRKSIDTNMHSYAGTLSTSIHDKQKGYLEKRISPNDFNKNKNLSHVRYQDLLHINKKNNSYFKKELNRRQSHLVKPTKNKSGSILKQFSPGLQPHPKSSFSNPYQSQKKHKGIQNLSRNSIKESSQDLSYQNILEQGKRMYKQSKPDKAIEIFKLILKNHQNIEVKYLLGICYMNTCQYQNGIKLFKQIIREKPQYKKNIYLLSAIAYKKINRIQESLNVLTEGLTVFDDYDCRIYRGKLYLKIMNWMKAEEDFQKAIKIDSTKGFAYLGKADAEKSQGKIIQSIKTLSQGMKTDSKRICLSKRAILLFENHQYDESLNDIQEILLNEPENTEIYYYRGMIYYQKKNKAEAILSFQQCLKNDNNQKFVTKAFEQMLKIQLQQKDYYGAHHLIGRAQSFQIGKLILQDWKYYVEAAILLMKKKYKQGIQLFNKLLKEKLYERKYFEASLIERQRYNFIKPLIHLYKGYAHFCLGDLQQAQKEYSQYTQYHLQLRTKENQISKQYNLLLLKAIKNFPQSEKYLINAIQLYPQKSQPYFYLAITETQKYISSQNSEYLPKIIKNLDLAVNFLPHLSNNHISNVYYTRSAIHLYIQQYDKAAADIDKAIQKSEDNIPKYFYLRGIIFACCGSFTTAIQDFNVAINLDQNFAKAYLERAKCLQLQGNPNEAFIDLQKYILMKPEDPNINKYAGFLLFENYSFQDCIQAFENGDHSIQDPQITLTKAKCYFLLGDLKKSIQNFQQYHSLAKDKSYLIDTIVINLIKTISEQKGIQRFETAIDILSKLIETKKTKGRIFKLADLHILRGASECSSKKFQNACKDFLSAIEIKQKQRIQTEQNNCLIKDDDDSEGEYEWSIFEIKYCLSLSYLAQGKYEESNQVLVSKFQDEDITFNIEKYQKFVNQFMDNNEFEKNQNRVFTLTNKKALSQYFPPIEVILPNSGDNQPCYVSLSFSYPEVEPPSLVPQFDHQIFLQFIPKNIENKPEAPWISRNTDGVIFTSNVEVYDNLELSVTSLNKNSEISKIQENQIAELRQQKSNVSIEHQQQQISSKVQKKEILKKFKLDSQTQLKLQKLLSKKRPV